MNMQTKPLIARRSPGPDGEKIITLAALAVGGQGGGVLTNWIVAAAAAEGLKSQATSVPGVAQRTGATTYYIEVADKADSAGNPVFALMPVAGDVDVVVASELLEAVRMAERGYVAADRTFLLASTHRILTTAEKMARGDGAADAAALMRAAEKGSRARFLFDANAIARATGAPINAVLLGAIAGLDLLPIPAAALRGAIAAGGIAVERNLKGFDAGLASATGSAPEGVPAAEAAHPRPARHAPPAALDQRIAGMPEAARDVIRIGAARLVDYQDQAYANRYLDRLERFADDPDLMREVARHLAVRMSFEDIIRVAQLKIRASRLERVRNDIGAAPDQPFELIDFFKPGIPELADMLPPSLGRALLAWAERKGIRDTAHFGMRVRTMTILGFLRIWILAKLKWWRPRSMRFEDEQAAIDEWLTLVARARAVSHDFAVQTADMARIVKGYGDTYRRGQASYRQLVDTMVRPVLNAPTGIEDPAAQLQGAIRGVLASAA